VIVAKRRNFLKVIYVDRRRSNFGDGNVCRQCLQDMTGVESDLVTSRPFFSEMEKDAAAAVDAHMYAKYQYYHHGKYLQTTCHAQ
jgi:hypothetical protein